MAAQRDHLVNPEEWRRTLEQLLRDVQLLRRALTRGEERLDYLEQSLLALIHDLLGPKAGALPAPEYQPVRRRGPKDARFLLDMAAQHGVDRLDIWSEANGAVMVRIDGGKPFRLSPRLALLLKVLKQDGGHEDGELVGWKSLADVQWQLEESSGCSFSKHSIEQLIHRLRKALESEGGANPRFIMTHPELGWRFALRKKPRS